ncbi:TIGR04104 family putative zinc finger protein [Psychrobacillus sp. FSL K6-1464]|uniref:TIGR04104 family putative zinc finger protein n=1 Tax=Psychrobacillus sp. FSL K6-1464 TaxID=2921545 RepID=UPI004046D5F7
MQKCNNCNFPFKWGKIYNSIMWFYKPIQCEQCGTAHTISFSSRFLASFMVLPIPIFGLILSPSENEYINVLIGICISLACSLLIPYFAKYENNT